MTLIPGSLLAGVFAASGWPRDFSRGWLIKRAVRELAQAGGGTVVEQRGRYRLEVHIPAPAAPPPRPGCGPCPSAARPVRRAEPPGLERAE